MPHTIFPGTEPSGSEEENFGIFFKYFHGS